MIYPVFYQAVNDFEFQHFQVAYRGFIAARDEGNVIAPYYIDYLERHRAQCNLNNTSSASISGASVGPSTTSHSTDLPVLSELTIKDYPKHDVGAQYWLETSLIAIKLNELRRSNTRDKAKKAKTLIKKLKGFDLQGNVRARYLLSEIYREGRGVKADTQKADYYLVMAALHVDIPSILECDSDIFNTVKQQFNIISAFNFDKVHRFVKLYADTNKPISIALHLLAKSTPTPDEKQVLLKTSAILGYIDAQESMAMLYNQIEPQWTYLAAIRGSVFGQYQIARNYMDKARSDHKYTQQARIFIDHLVDNPNFDKACELYQLNRSDYILDHLMMNYCNDSLSYEKHYAKIIELIRQQHAHAHFYLAMLYKQGFDKLPCDLSQMINHLKEAAKCDYWLAFKELASLHLDGFSVGTQSIVANAKLAILYHEKMVNLDVAEMSTYQNLAGLYFDAGQQSKLDELVTRATDKGHHFILDVMIEKMMGLGDMNQINGQLIIDYYKRKVASVRLDRYDLFCIWFNLSGVYLYGTSNSQPNVHRAIGCLHKAMKYHDDPECELILGTAYHDLAFDKIKYVMQASHHYEAYLAKQPNNPKALYNYAGLKSLSVHEGGANLPASEILELFVRAKANGCPNSAFYIGGIYFSGAVNGNRDIDKALEHFIEAYDNGNDDAIYPISECYRLLNNLARHDEFIQIGVSRGIAECQHALAMKQISSNDESHLEQALTHFHEAASNGFAPSQYYYGMILREIHTQAEQQATALDYLHQAAQAHYPPAVLTLEKIKKAQVQERTAAQSNAHEQRETPESTGDDTQTPVISNDADESSESEQIELSQPSSLPVRIAPNKSKNAPQDNADSSISPVSPRAEFFEFLDTTFESSGSDDDEQDYACSYQQVHRTLETRPVDNKTAKLLEHIDTFLTTTNRNEVTMRDFLKIVESLQNDPSDFITNKTKSSTIRMKARGHKFSIHRPHGANRSAREKLDHGRIKSMRQYVTMLKEDYVSQQSSSSTNSYS